MSILHAGPLPQHAGVSPRPTLPGQDSALASAGPGAQGRGSCSCSGSLPSTCDMLALGLVTVSISKAHVWDNAREFRGD